MISLFSHEFSYYTGGCFITQRKFKRGYRVSGCKEVGVNYSRTFLRFGVIRREEILFKKYKEYAELLGLDHSKIHLVKFMYGQRAFSSRLIEFYGAPYDNVVTKEIAAIILKSIVPFLNVPTNLENLYKSHYFQNAKLKGIFKDIPGFISKVTGKHLTRCTYNFNNALHGGLINWLNKGVFDDII